MDAVSRRVLLAASSAAWVCSATPIWAQQAGTLNIGTVNATNESGAQTRAPASGTGTLGQAQKLQKLAPNVITVQPQSEIRKLPDVNVAEALQRVPGISLESDSGAGRYINIRGLDADLNSVSYGGVKLPATNSVTVSGGSRATALDVFPAGLIGGFEVVKSLTPEMNAEGLGGLVNLLPPTLPADGHPLLDMTLGGGIESLRGTGVYNGNITAGERFSIPGLHFANPKPFSFIGTYGYHSDERGIDDFEEDYAAPTVGGKPVPVKDLQARHYDESRVVRGYSGELDFDPTPQTHIYLRGLHSGYFEGAYKNRLQILGLDGSGTGGALTANGGGSFTATGATALHQFTNTEEHISLNLVELGARTVLGNFATVDAHSSYTQGSDIFTRGFNSVFTDPNSLVVNYNVASPARRTFNAINMATGAPENLADPNNFLYSNITNTPSRAFDQIFENAANVSIPTTFGKADGIFKAGVDIRLREKSSRQAEFDGTPNDPNIPLSAVTNHQPDAIYYNGIYNVGPYINNKDVFAVPTTYVENTNAELAAFQHNTENVYAGYAQETINVGKLTILGGARLEATDGTYGAFASTTDVNGNKTFAPNVNHQSYVNVFPSVQFKYAFSPAFQMRAAYSTAIARPGFQQITAATTTDFQASTVIQGNPSLKPTTGDSFDVTAAYYTKHAGLLSADLFYKTFSNYIVQTSVTGTLANPVSGLSQPALITSFENVNGATAKGLELDAIQQFYFLPFPFNGLGVEGNLTIVDATAQVHQGLRKSILPQTSPFNYNAAIFYEQGPLSMRLAASYVGRNVFAVGADPSTDIYSQPRFRLDLGATYNITPRLQLYADVKNITNTKLEFTQSASAEYPIQREFYGQDYFFGLHYRLD